MILRCASLLAAMLLLFPAVAAADELRVTPKAVVELFTSQGCASCPPADKLFSELAERDDVVALSYHVDYWDYAGWTDTFGAAANTAYQQGYAKRWGSGRLYTPQLVVNGLSGVVGSRRGEVSGVLAKARLWLPVELERRDNMLAIDIAGKLGGNAATVWLVTYRDRAEVRIEQGDNRGAVMAYSNIVTGRHMLGAWEPETGAHLVLPLDKLMVDGTTGAAILVQEDGDGMPGPILGAAAFAR